MAKNVPTVLKGDPGRLRQVLINLTGNALKFTERGKIELFVELVKDLGQEAIIKFSIRDTGIGIPKDKLDILFKKFSQVDASISRKFGGTGLGLAISKKIVELMDGQIGVESQEGEGSTFWFTVKLPKGEQTESSRETIKKENGQEVRARDIRLRGRVLVVEDNPVNQKVVIGLLRRLGVRAEAVNNGKEAIEILEIIPYDLVLMDIQMPVMDGFSATRTIRSRDSKVLNRQIPIIAVTAHAFKEEVSKCIDSGMNDYLSKPIEPQRLKEVLAKWLPVRSEDEMTGQNYGTGKEVSSEQELSSGKTEQPIFDKDDFLERTMNDAELGRQVLEMFHETGSGLLSSLEEAIKNEHIEEIMRIAHSLKGSSGNVGAKRLSDIALLLEKMSKEGKPSEILEKLEGLKREFENFWQDDEVKKILG